MREESAGGTRRGGQGLFWICLLQFWHVWVPQYLQVFVLISLEQDGFGHLCKLGSASIFLATLAPFNLSNYPLPNISFKSLSVYSVLSQQRNPVNSPMSIFAIIESCWQEWQLGVRWVQGQVDLLLLCGVSIKSSVHMQQVKYFVCYLRLYSHHTHHPVYDFTDFFLFRLINSPALTFSPLNFFSK